MRLRLLVLLWISAAVWAQAPGVDWESTTQLGSDFEALSLREDGLGGVVAAGFTDVNFDYDVVVQNYSSSGTINWITHLTSGDDEQGTGIALSVGGYAVCGWQSSFGGPADFILRLLNSSGSPVGSFSYGTSDDEAANDIQMTSDFGFVMCGYRERVDSGRDFHLVKTDFAGAMQWTKTYGGPAEDVAHAVLQTPDNGYIVVGETQSFGFGGRDMWILRLDANGDSLWSLALFSADDEVAYGVTQTNDGGYAVAGYQSDFADQNVLLVKIASSGALLWSTVFDNGGFDVAHDVDACADNGLVLCGRSDVGGSEDQTVWKFDEIGQHYWTVQTGEASGDNAFEIRQLASGGYIYCGFRANPQAEAIRWSVVKLLPDVPLDGPLPVELLSFGAAEVAEGIQVTWQTASETDVESFEIWRGQNDSFELIHLTESRGSGSRGESYSFTDQTVEVNQEYDYFLTVVNLNGSREELRGRMASATWSGAEVLPESFEVRAYPNPFNPTTTIEFTLAEAGNVSLAIYDNAGRLVETMTRSANAGTVTFDWNAEGKTSGTYFAKVSGGGGSRVVRLVLLK